MIKEGNFQLISWEEIYDKIDEDHILNLLSAIRNALFYGVENKTIRGIVKAGFTHSIENWNNHRDKVDKDLIVIGDRAIKVANEFIKKNKIKVE
ncbi:MAG: hypothetical protein V1718_02805 [archaeon]